jgi:sugar/nucleoside kinase (ribokinase family)
MVFRRTRGRRVQIARSSGTRLAAHRRAGLQSTHVGEVSIIGNVNLDVVVRPAVELPPPGTERIVERIEVRTGGAAAISALTMSALGSPPTLVGCVGDDRAGAILRSDLEDAGVDCALTTVEGVPTGVSVAVEAPARDRAFLTFSGSLASFDPSMIPDRVVESDLLLLCGYFLLPGLRGEPMIRLLTDVRERGGKTLFDPGADPAGWEEERTRREILDLLPLVDVFLPNIDEATALTGETDIIAAGRLLQRVSAGLVVLKLGSEGSMAIESDGAVVRRAAPAVRVTDTTGAGDAFNGGLLYALTAGGGLSEALPFATRVASTVVSRPSAIRYPPLNEVSMEWRLHR